MAMTDNFAVFILTHGRPDRVITCNTLIKQGYTGPIYIVIDNEDKRADEYRQRFGDNLIVFDKQDIANRYDTGDNFNDRRSVFFARNACFEIANDLGIEYFLELDDDYTRFYYGFNQSLEYAYGDPPVKNLDRLFEMVLRYYQTIEAKTIAFGQSGDRIGGSQSTTSGVDLHLKRKAMNTFFCSTKRPFAFVGRVNEDVNTYVCLGHRGDLFLTIFNIFIHQITTQQSSGGMSDLYFDEGTYIKSFYTVMYAPSCTKIYLMGETHKRLHHKINWDNAVPCIIDEKLRKSESVNT